MKVFALALLLMLAALPLRAERALVAVAANFLAPAEVLAAHYTADTGHRIELASGATGQHYAQILHGAPYDLFLSADADRPERLEAQGLASGRVTYALGRLALVGAESLQTLPEARYIAIANPDLAPYGRAAREVLQNAGLWDTLEPRIVQGQNVGQAFGMVASGNAQAGLVALSQAQGLGAPFWPVPADLHAPIRQDAVLLPRGQTNPAAVGFVDFLTSDAARALIETAGYTAP
jgi:molybdate transport system substrate-binding protein